MSRNNFTDSKKIDEYLRICFLFYCIRKMHFTLLRYYKELKKILENSYINCVNSLHRWQIEYT